MSSDAGPSSSSGSLVAALATSNEARWRARNGGGRLEVHTLANGPRVAVPPPATLATVWAVPMLRARADWLREGKGFRRRPHGSTDEPTPVDMADVVAELRAELAALPECDDAAESYKHLRLFIAAAGPDLVDDYLTRLARAVRKHLDELPREQPKRVALTAEERTARIRASKAAYQRQARAEVREGSRDDMMWATGWASLWREQATPGTHPAATVHRTYATKVDEAGRTPVGRNTFFRLADEVCGPRKRRASGPVYVVPQEVTPMNREQRKELASLIVDRLTDEWREHAIDGLADLVADRQAEREHVAPVAAPAVVGHGNVISLDSRRRRAA